MQHLELVVAGARRETELIRRLELVRADGGPLPGFSAGAHVTIAVPGVGPRKYSLVNATPAAEATARPVRYVLGIRLEETGGGGSRYLCGLSVGDRLTVEPPQNNFPLRPHTSPFVLLAGGIGVTPLISMAAELKAAGHPFSLTYAARSGSEMAFLDELRALAGPGLRLHADDVEGRVFDMGACLDGLRHDEPVYMCGPKPMLKAGLAAAKALGWKRDRLAFELFYSVAPTEGAPAAPAAAPPPAEAQAHTPGGAFEVVLRSSGRSFLVPPDKSILDVLIEAGEDPMHDCRRGECGVCQVGVVEGVPDHRDVILSESERASGKVMQICISRAKSARIVLDL